MLLLLQIRTHRQNLFILFSAGWLCYSECGIDFCSSFDSASAKRKWS